MEPRTAVSTTYVPCLRGCGRLIGVDLGFEEHVHVVGTRIHQATAPGVHERRSDEREGLEQVSTVCGDLDSDGRPFEEQINQLRSR